MQESQRPNSIEVSANGLTWQANATILALGFEEC
jgi:hypothetical protein